jgi:hypothetical protein
MRILKIDYTERNLRNSAIPLFVFHVLHEPRIMRGTGIQTWLRKLDDSLNAFELYLQKVILSTLATTAT